MPSTTSTRTRVVILAALSVAATGATFLLPRLPQTPSYHNLADQRKILGIPNLMDVISNAGFALVGIQGLLFLWRRRKAGPDGPFTESWERWASAALFAAVGGIAAGSAYYHLRPDNATLLWDRLPMAVVFMSMFALVIGDRIGMRAGRLLFPLLLAAGIGSVLYWRYTEAIGAGDVRFYGLVQYFPMLAIPLLLLLFAPRYTGTANMAGVVAWYALAKVLELLDEPVFHATRVVGGHALKHVAAALAAYWILRMLRGRRPIREPGP